MTAGNANNGRTNERTNEQLSGGVTGQDGVIGGVWKDALAFTGALLCFLQDCFICTQWCIAFIGEYCSVVLSSFLLERV